MVWILLLSNSFQHLSLTNLNRKLNKNTKSFTFRGRVVAIFGVQWYLYFWGGDDLRLGRMSRGVYISENVSFLFFAFIMRLRLRLCGKSAVILKAKSQVFLGISMTCRLWRMCLLRRVCVVQISAGAPSRRGLHVVLCGLF